MTVALQRFVLPWTMFSLPLALKVDAKPTNTRRIGKADTKARLMVAVIVRQRLPEQNPKKLLRGHWESCPVLYVQRPLLSAKVWFRDQDST